MKLDEFIDETIGRLVDKEGYNNILKIIKKEVNKSGNYDTTKIEFQVFTDDNNIDCDACFTGDHYADGEIIFIDCHIKTE